MCVFLHRILSVSSPSPFFLHLLCSLSKAKENNYAWWAIARSYEWVIRKKNRTHFQCEKLNIKKREKKRNFCFASGEFIGFFFSNLFHISFIFECFVCTAKFQLLLRSTVMLFTLVFQNVFMYCAACHPADSSTEQQTNST